MELRQGGSEPGRQQIMDIAKKNMLQNVRMKTRNGDEI